MWDVIALILDHCLFIYFTVCVLHGRLSNFVCVLLSVLSIEGRMWDVIVLIPDHCLSIYFSSGN